MDAQVTMPPFNRSDGSTKGILINLGRKGLQQVQAILAPASKKNFLRFLALDKKESRMKFHECIIIRCKFMNGHKILIGLWHMKNIFEDNVTIMGVNN
jgi:hypothetical protein